MPLPTSSPAHRPTCPRCSRPLRTCLCGWVRPTANQVSVLLLQHPLEASHAKGSAALLHLSLPRCQREVGEQFEPSILATWLGAAGQAVLLYPATEPSSGAAQAPATAWVPPSLAELPHLRLVVLDATWRKSRKMLHSNPLLAQLPRLSLQAPPPSRYSIRKAQQPHQRSTLEATVLALQHLEGDEMRYQPLLQAFEGFVAAQGAFAPQC